MKKTLKSIAQYVKYSDNLLLLYCVAISGFGVILLSSLYYNAIIDSVKIVIIQSVAVGLGLAVAISISLFDYHFLAQAWKVHLPITLGLTLLTFVPGVAYTPPGSDDSAWLDLFGITTLQPSELLKITIILTLALHLSRVKDKINKVPTLALVFVHGLAPVVLIMLQGDTGTAMIFALIFLTMLFVSGISWRYIAAGLLSLCALVPFVWFVVFQDLHRNRFMIVLNPELDPLGGGMQQLQGRIAIGSGGLFGKGLFNGNLVNNVPYVQNDFIFSYIGQTLGFVGCMATILLLGAICVKILFVGRMAKDDLGKLICVGVCSMLLFQSLINIGMVLVVFPVIGITLPFLSQGGTSVVTNFMAIGVVMSVYYKNKQKNLFED